MDYNELRTLFFDILNRTDCTDTEADKFLTLGLRRVGRILRTPLQEDSYTFTAGDPWNGVIIPPTYLSMIAITVDGITVERLGNLNDPPKGPGTSAYFRIEGSMIDIYPAPTEGTEVVLRFYGTFDETTNPTDNTKATASIPDLVVYAALTYAASQFQDERRMEFRETMAELVEEVQNQADSDLLTGGAAIVNPYAGMC